MRLALVGAALFALPLLTSTANAQHFPKAVPQQQEHPLYDERKYKAATETVPDQKQNDPWAGAREPSATVANPPPKGAKTKRNN